MNIPNKLFATILLSTFLSHGAIQLDTNNMHIVDDKTQESIQVTNVYAKIYKNKYIRLHWKKLPNVKYILYKNSGNGYKTVAITSKTSFIDKHIKIDKTYSYKLICYKRYDGKLIRSEDSKITKISIPKPKPKEIDTETPTEVQTTTQQPTEQQTQEPTTEYQTIPQYETEHKTYSDYDLYLMSHLINGEAGCDWCSDAEQRAVGSVVLNRMRDSRFPNTMAGVIYQRGQYACTWDGNFDLQPSERAIANAKYILTYGSTLPSNVVFQARSVQGEGVYTKIGVHYFCY